MALTFTRKKLYFIKIKHYRNIRNKKSHKYKKIRIRYLRKIRSLKLKLWALSSKVNIGVFMKNPYREIPNIERKTGKKIKVFLWYQSIQEDFNVILASWLYLRGIKLQLAWEPHNPLKSPNNQPEYRLKTIISGQHDNEIYRWAIQIKSFGKPLYFRPMCEMNADWTAWAGKTNGNIPQDYIPAWRHIHNIFKKVGATNAIFVWAPNQDSNKAAALKTFRQYYPGSAYVDYIGMNGYNWGRMYNTPKWTSRWQSFSQVFGPSYTIATKYTKKPLMICEMASTEIGGNKAVWIKDAFWQIKTKYRRIRIVTWFNINKETDWRVHTKASNLKAFKTYAF